MKAIREVFETKKKLASVFFTAGFPRTGRMKELCVLLEKAGVDMIEIGIPCSDPLADGPIIQQSSMKALANGFTLEKMFVELHELRNEITVPVLLMGYYNQVLQYGAGEFVCEAKKCGVNGFIIPDQPLQSEFSELCVKNDLANVRLVCPTTSNERIKMLDELSSGFLYAVSSSATTGGNVFDNAGYFKKLGTLELKNKLIAGFGIKDAAGFKKATEFTNGGIIGSAFIEFISKDENLNQGKINEFVHAIISAISEK
jgi:tryptophan synthase alpha chain